MPQTPVTLIVFPIASIPRCSVEVHFKRDDNNYLAVIMLFTLTLLQIFLLKDSVILESLIVGYLCIIFHIKYEI